MSGWASCRSRARTQPTSTIRSALMRREMAAGGMAAAVRRDTRGRAPGLAGRCRRQPGAERVGGLRFHRRMTPADRAQVMRVLRVGEVRGGIAAEQRETVFPLQVVPVVLEQAGLLEVAFFREELDDFEQA